MENQRCSEALKRDLPVFAALLLSTLPLLVYGMVSNDSTLLKCTLDFTLLGLGVLGGWFMAMDTIKDEEKKVL